MSFRQLFVRLYDVLWREPKLICKYYIGVRGKKQGTIPKPQTSNLKSQTPLYVFRVDGRVGHGGMFDRLKGMISVYAVAKTQGKGFRVLFTYPFTLEKYLEPRDYDWRLKEGELTEHYPQSRPLFIYGECYHPTRLMKDRRRQTHFYYGYNSLDKINEHFHTDYDWGKLYHELFRPTAYLQQFIDRHQREIGSDYIVVHTRFLNLLGDKTETAINPELPFEEREPYMRRIVEEIRRIVESPLPVPPREEGVITSEGELTDCSSVRPNKVAPSLGWGEGERPPRVMIASDSMTFIDYVKRQIPDVYVVPGKVKHIDTAGQTDDSENIKMFLDYYLIGGAKKVYNIVGPGMWPSAFPEYAAKIGQTEFERIIIDNR